VLRPLAERLPVSTENFSFDFKVKQFLRGARLRPEIRDHVWVGSFPPGEQRQLLQADAGEFDDYADVLQAEQDCSSRNMIERLIYLYCKFYLQDCILVKVDRASMACSLEVRAPFLDYTFVEFASTIPVHLKLKRLNTKYILKRAMQGKLPPDILTRAKKGFGIPVAKWFRSDLIELVRDTFSESRLRRQGLFKSEAVARLLDEHLQGVRDHRKQLWTLFIFQLWLEKYLEPPELGVAGAGVSRSSPTTARPDPVSATVPPAGDNPDRAR
jgi:asparagine synthase (glutamine-hydrolysing)